MPLVEISVAKGDFTPEQKKELGKAVNDSITEVFQKIRGRKPRPGGIWILIREESTDNWLSNGETLTERRKKL